MTARPTVVAMIIIRRPPRMRSIAGPMRGVTTAKGAIVSSRARATRPRDSSGLIEKKIDPASAAVIAPSDAAATGVDPGKPDKGCDHESLRTAQLGLRASERTPAFSAHAGSLRGGLSGAIATSNSMSRS